MYNADPRHWWDGKLSTSIRVVGRVVCRVVGRGVGRGVVGRGIVGCQFVLLVRVVAMVVSLLFKFKE